MIRKELKPHFTSELCTWIDCQMPVQDVDIVVEPHPNSPDRLLVTLSIPKRSAPWLADYADD
jgi:hypothetical protein